MGRVGSSYIGSNSLQTSTANIEIIPDDISCYKFSFKNDQSCHVKINGNSGIYLRAGQGFECDQYDKDIYSFVIVEADVTFNFIGAI